MAPSHYLNQCWLIISKVQWHASEGNFTRDTLISKCNLKLLGANVICVEMIVIVTIIFSWEFICFGLVKRRQEVLDFWRNWLEKCWNFICEFCYSPCSYPVTLRLLWSYLYLSTHWSLIKMANLQTTFSNPRFETKFLNLKKKKSLKYVCRDPVDKMINIGSGYNFLHQAWVCIMKNG